MIDPDMRNAIFQLHQEGMSLREISRRLHVSRNAVRTIVRQQGKITRKERKDKRVIRDLRTWKAHTRSTGASSLLPDDRNSKKAKVFDTSMNREEAPVLPREEPKYASAG